MTLFQLKENMSTLSAEINEVSGWISDNAAKPEIKLEDIRAKMARRDDLNERFEAIKAAHDRLEAQERAKIPAENNQIDNPQKAKEEAKAAFYRKSILGVTIDAPTKALLGGIPQGESNGGENLLPSNMEMELITEPMQTNSMRSIEPVSNITGLEIPKIDFEFDDSNLEDVTDAETAKEIKTEGNKVTFGKFKSKIKVNISDTIVHGTPTNLVATVENGLRSGLALKEKMREFALTPDATHAHMSFYSNHNNIKIMKGATLLSGILRGYGDLADMFAENATVVMRRVDYVNMIRELANGSDALYGKKPEDVIGVPVEFNDRAIKPIVGDFRFARWNYENGTIYDTDKDVDQGVYKFVLTAWHDHRILLKSAFRIIEIGEDAENSDGQMAITSVQTVDTLPTNNILDGVIYALTATDGDKTAGTMWYYVNSTWEQYIN